MRGWLFLGFLISAAAASASYDLMLVGENPTGGDARVWRYDPISRRTLGSFGAGLIPGSITSVAVDGGRGIAHVLTASNHVFSFDYSTGEYVGSGQGNSGRNVAVDTVRGWVTVGNGVGNGHLPLRAFDPTNPAVDFTYDTNFYFGTGLIRAPGSNRLLAWGLDFAATGIRAVTLTDGPGPTFLSNLSQQWNGTNVPRSSAVLGDRFYGLGANGSNLQLFSLQQNGGLFSGSPSVTIVGTATNNIHLAAGHRDMLWIGNGDRVIAYNTRLGLVQGNHVLPFGTPSTLAGMAVVVAPEPGTLLALGVGLAALARRRRRPRA